MFENFLLGIWMLEEGFTRFSPFFTQENMTIMERQSSNFITIADRLTGSFGKKSDIDTEVLILGIWGLKNHTPISTIFTREMAYLKGTICAKFHSNIFIRAWFIYFKVKEPDEIENCVIREVDVVIIRTRPFSQSDIRIQRYCYVPDLVEIDKTVAEIWKFI